MADFVSFNIFCLGCEAKVGTEAERLIVVIELLIDFARTLDISFFHLESKIFEICSLLGNIDNRSWGDSWCCREWWQILPDAFLPKAVAVKPYSKRFLMGTKL